MLRGRFVGGFEFDALCSTMDRNETREKHGDFDLGKRVAVYTFFAARFQMDRH